MLQYSIGGYRFGLQQELLPLTQDEMSAKFAYDGTDAVTAFYQAPFDPAMLGEYKILKRTVGLHHKLLQQDALVIHASYIEFMGRGILFLGPSGTGKSTQARLWNEHAGAPILNGDRALLRQKDGIWQV